jgi:hypothetical protein
VQIFFEQKSYIMLLHKLGQSLAIIAVLFASANTAQAQTNSDDNDTKSVIIATKFVEVIAACQAEGGVSSLKGRMVKQLDRGGIYTCAENNGADSTTLILVGEPGKESGAASFYYTIDSDNCIMAAKAYVHLKNALVESKSWKQEEKTEGSKLSYILSDTDDMPRVTVVVDSEKNTMVIGMIVLCN